MILDHSGEYRFHSTLNPKAKEISIVVKEMMWVKRNRRGMSTPPNMGQMTESHPTLSVLEGPWEFKIVL